ncbi:DNA repair protein RAD51 homolog 4 isoform X1 [Diachasma alloeum]|uniref:RAD51 D-like n=1 Tax=Diachasma alloeum TaxID=454923 RepID=A0A4E0S4I1_9HYME|nr:DNA repair protein RAD51 homolog 4 isoform X1 [Diachasma alloeum]XP_015114844.1 DNA repair protein RAD51 homolog 4 isoform X1 [Diachasma alloeum]XP_028982039.1 DNA repair protein RAD51 homolog 4 isoform X1 [Diachasma alloeum]XP_028982040.1 DNA repair protein RAD51 homolog 4 isoform X1 [Diachasma alloeum]THK33073.1 RAD51 D-like [Diachasma alloeum]
MARLGTVSIPQLNATIVKQLSSRKIFTVDDFIAETTESMTKITGLAYKDILAIRKEIVYKHGGKVKNTLQSLDEERESVSTGIPSLDILLNGGLHPGQMYEFCGTSSSGKTSICLAISTNVALNSDFVVHYIDSKRDFSSSRIQMILEERKVSNEEVARVMGQIKLTQIQSLPELFSTLYSLVSAKDDKLRVIIIDSLHSLFHVTTDNYESLYSLNHLWNICKYLADECCLSVITVNAVTQWRENESLPVNGAETSTIIKPMLGRFWRGVPNTRIYVEEMGNDKRKLTICKSHELSIGKNVEIKIVNSGII